VTAKVLPREYGVKLVFDGCGATEQTAMCGKRSNRDWFATKGWGRGTDSGSPARDPLPERTTTYPLRGIEVTRTLPATTGSPGRPSNLSHDLCPDCVRLDRERAALRREERSKQIAAMDAKRKERDAEMRR